MKRYFSLFVFLPVAVFLFAYSWAQELPEIIIEDADATTTIDLATPPADFFIVNEPPFLLPDEMAICHADAREVIDLATPPEDFFDASEADLRLSDEVAICRADKRLTIDLVAPPEEFFDPAPEATDKFVYVALGDSYQSGEGAGNSIQDSTQYLNEAYEQGTYTDTLVPGNDSCHRALQNYAKINKNKFHPELNDEDIVLIDLTCSGAKIETGPRPPVVGDVASNQIAPNSQLQQALNKLGEAGLTPADVDLATVGMGGNDAKFADLVYACVLPSILRRALQEYPDPPAEIEFLADQFATCENFDRFFVNSQDTISKLYTKEIWAQDKLLQTFTNARILQLNYPNILPEKEKSPAWCSAIRKEDIDYARKKIKSINQKIEEAFNNSAANPRFEFVNVENSLGDNALCPAEESDALANNIDESNFNAEIRRLLNLDGNGDVRSRALINDLVSAYDDWKKCSARHLVYIAAPDWMRLLIQDCNVGGAWGNVKGKFDLIADYLLRQKLNSDVLPNLIAPVDSGGSNEIRFDKSQGLFHPNAKGHAIAACNVLSAYNKASSAHCLPVATPLFVCLANGNPAGNIPFNVIPDDQIRIEAGGFGFNEPVAILLHSTQIKLAEVVADGNGNINALITLPSADPGVHVIELRGNAASGAAIGQEIRINYPGEPAGDGGYSVYLSGFNQSIGDDEESEKVFIDYADQTFGPYIPDENGGVLVQVPLLGQAGAVTVKARSDVTGKIVEETIEVTDTTPPEIFIISPQSGRTYANNQILPIDFRVVDNQPANDIVQTEIYLNGAVVSGNSVDLSLQKTGNHRLEINAQDDAGNIARAESDFAVSADIGSIIANISHYYDLKMIKLLSTRNALLAAAKSLKLQLEVLDRLKQGALPITTKNSLIKLSQKSINRQIDALVVLVNNLPAKSIDARAKELLADSLQYIKIK